VCELCGKESSQRTVHDRHMQTHSDERNYQCGECGKRFKDKYQVSRHMYIHTGGGKNECYICGEKFARVDYWRKHMATRHGEQVDEIKKKLVRVDRLLKDEGDDSMESEEGEYIEMSGDVEANNAKYVIRTESGEHVQIVEGEGDEDEIQVHIVTVDSDQVQQGDNVQYEFQVMEEEEASRESTRDAGGEGDDGQTVEASG